MANIDNLLSGAAGGVIVLVLKELFDYTKGKYFSNRPRLFIEVDSNNPFEISLHGTDVRITIQVSDYCQK